MMSLCDTKKKIQPYFFSSPPTPYSLASFPFPPLLPNTTLDRDNYILIYRRPYLFIFLYLKQEPTMYFTLIIDFLLLIFWYRLLHAYIIYLYNNSISLSPPYKLIVSRLSGCS